MVFSFFPDFYKEWYDRKTLTAAEREAINRFLADYRIPPNNIYANGLCTDLETIAEFDLGFATAGYFLYEEPLSAGAILVSAHEVMIRLAAAMRMKAKFAAKAVSLSVRSRIQRASVSSRYVLSVAATTPSMGVDSSINGVANVLRYE